MMNFLSLPGQFLSSVAQVQSEIETTQKEKQKKELNSKEKWVFFSLRQSSNLGRKKTERKNLNKRKSTSP